MPGGVRLPSQLGRILQRPFDSTFKASKAIALQLSPIFVGSSCTGHNEDRDGELATRAPDFLCAVANVNNLVSRRLIGAAQGWELELVLEVACYSARSVIIGSTRVARRAGM